MNTRKQDEFVKQYKAGCLSFCLKYFTSDNFDSELLCYIDRYKEFNKLSKSRKEEASNYLMGILNTLEEVKFAVKDKDFVDEMIDKANKNSLFNRSKNV